MAKKKTQEKKNYDNPNVVGPTACVPVKGDDVAGNGFDFANPNAFRLELVINVTLHANFSSR